MLETNQMKKIAILSPCGIFREPPARSLYFAHYSFYSILSSLSCNRVHSPNDRDCGSCRREAWNAILWPSAKLLTFGLSTPLCFGFLTVQGTMALKFVSNFCIFDDFSRDNARDSWNVIHLSTFGNCIFKLKQVTMKTPWGLERWLRNLELDRTFGIDDESPEQLAWKILGR